MIEDPFHILCAEAGKNEVADSQLMALPVGNCVILPQLLNLSEPQFVPQ